MKKKCSIMFPHDRPEDVSGCVHTEGHDGPHLFLNEYGQQYEWLPDDDCNCKDCQSDNFSDHCVVYNEVEYIDVYVHKKSGNKYLLVGVADNKSGQEKMVVYTPPRL